MWNLPAPPGFIGFDPQKPVRIYERTLPHWRQEGVTYLTTFRLADSLPEPRLRELLALRAEWEKLNPPPRSEIQWKQLSRTTIEHIERWLDEGAGSCVLQEVFAADILERKLKHFDGVQYELGAYVIMPNHAHVLVRPYSDSLNPLETIEQAWKAYSAREINLQRNEQGQLWQAESFDRIVRDEEHLWRCLQYIGDNARRAGLSLSQARRWVCPAWIQAGWKFER
jgi:REP element-mobilizing transposase RayT